MSDSEFKNLDFIMPYGWQVNSRGNVIDGNKYAPDVSFKNGSNKVLCVVESSSTNDRKVGPGELLLAHKYFVDEKINGMIIYSLCGSSDSRPTPSSQCEYIRPYFDYLKNLSTTFGLKKVIIINEKEFKELKWDIWKLVCFQNKSAKYLN